MTFEELKKLKYFECVQKEVLRMDSSVGMIFPRRALKDHYLGNMKIREGMAVSIRLRGIHFQETQFDSPL